MAGSGGPSEHLVERSANCRGARGAEEGGYFPGSVGATVRGPFCVPQLWQLALLLPFARRACCLRLFSPRRRLLPSHEDRLSVQGERCGAAAALLRPGDLAHCGRWRPRPPRRSCWVSRPGRFACAAIRMISVWCPSLPCVSTTVGAAVCRSSCAATRRVVPQPSVYLSARLCGCRCAPPANNCAHSQLPASGRRTLQRRRRTSSGGPRPTPGSSLPSASMSRAWFSQLPMSAHTLRHGRPPFRTTASSAASATRSQEQPPMDSQPNHRHHVADIRQSDREQGARDLIQARRASAHCSGCPVSGVKL